MGDGTTCHTCRCSQRDCECQDLLPIEHAGQCDLCRQSRPDLRETFVKDGTRAGDYRAICQVCRDQVTR
jgi:hypothetical protein